MDKDTSEIAKLTERISKDPKSKLFVPLAEEYKKTGDIEMSILVLTEGLKNNPGYVTARSFLGRLLIEKGDLPAAQKEFEEVVKVIPDNLMAQRKLGDLYALQDRTADALNHYKIALSLNPKDQETALLVSEAEAGRDIKKYLPKPKPAAVEEQQKKQEPLQAAVVRSAPKPEQKPAQASAPAKKPEPVHATAAAEEPEEVLVVEPLDPVADLDRELAAKNLDFLAEGHEPSFAQPEEEKGDALFSLNEPFAIQSPEVEEQPATAADDPFAAGIKEEEQEKQADDFTTDTLAELYISQGFFEKAVDIYERMLVDKPNSQGLKDKLAKVRAMAAAAAPAEGPATESKSVIPAGFTQEEAAPEKPEPESSDLDAYVPPPVHAIPEPRLDDFELPATKTIPALDEDATPPVRPQRQQPKHFDVGFEPREYVLPDAVPRQTGEEPPNRPPAQQTADRAAVEQVVDRNIQAPRKSAATKKETVARLETWLKNIMKES